jgi:hypothetical protein
MNRCNWFWLVVAVFAIWYWHNDDRVDPKSKSYSAGELAGYTSGYGAGVYNTCLRLNQVAPDIAADLRRDGDCR